MKRLSFAVLIIVLTFSICLFFSCKKKSNIPDIPSIPFGPSRGGINTDYTFTSSADDPDGDSLTIRFAWGDNDTSNWSSWRASGDSVLMTHSWSNVGSYSIKAQAKDKKDVTSDWSEVHQIVISSGGGGWTKTFGGTNNDEGCSVQQTQDGGYIIAGGTNSYGAGNGDVYLIKTDASGNQQWYRTFGGSSGDWGSSVQQTTDGGYIITGSTYSYGAGYEDVYLIKTDTSGNQQWYKTFGDSSYDDGSSVQQTSDGGYIITGTTRSYGVGGDDVYLIKTEANGNTMKTFFSNPNRNYPNPSQRLSPKFHHDLRNTNRIGGR